MRGAMGRCLLLGSVALLVSAAAWADPDLAVSIAPTTYTGRVNELVPVTVIVTNDPYCPGNAGPFKVALFIDPAGTPTTSSVPYQVQSVAGLASGGSVTLTFLVSSSVAAAHTLQAYVDFEEAVAEESEYNTSYQATLTLTDSGPDLIVTNVVPSATTVVDGESLSVDITIQNVGDTDIPAGTSITVQLAEGRVPDVWPASPYSIQSLFVSTGLAAGATATVTAGFHAYQGRNVICTRVDPHDGVAETNESNNLGSPVEVEVTPTGGPDLVVVSITPSDASPLQTNPITVDVVVANVGDADAGGFTVALFYDEPGVIVGGMTPDDTDTVSSLAAGAQTTVNFTGVVSAVAALWMMTAEVDFGEAVAEKYENNNVGSRVEVLWRNVLGGNADLVTSVVLSTDVGYTGNTTRVYVRVANAGDVAAGGFQVEVYVAPDAVPSVGSLVPGDQSQGVASLAPGASVLLEFPAVPLGSLARMVPIYGLADRLNAVDEGGATGNNLSAAVDMWVYATSTTKKDCIAGSVAGYPSLTGAVSWALLALALLPALRRRRRLAH